MSQKDTSVLKRITRLEALTASLLAQATFAAKEATALKLEMAGPVQARPSRKGKKMESIIAHALAKRELSLQRNLKKKTSI